MSNAYLILNDDDRNIKWTSHWCESQPKIEIPPIEAVWFEKGQNTIEIILRIAYCVYRALSIPRQKSINQEIDNFVQTISKTKRNNNFSIWTFLCFVYRKSIHGIWTKAVNPSLPQTLSQFGISFRLVWLYRRPETWLLYGNYLISYLPWLIACSLLWSLDKHRLIDNRHHKFTK